MNILYIHTHDTGRYIEPYGYNIPTPNLMEFAKSGTLFRKAFSMAPTCSPSRAALLTGMAPHTNGMLGLAHRGFQLNDYSQHLVQFLNKNNYETVLSGIQHVVNHKLPKEVVREKIGYDYFLDGYDKNNNSDISNAKAVADYINKNKDKDKQFFISFGMFNTHRNFPGVDEGIDSNYVMPPFPTYDTKETREDMARYISSAKIVDQCIGIVLNALKESGLREDTMIIFTTDHGIAFPRMKCNLYDTGIGVSLIIDFPGNQPRGQACDALVSHVDIFPTICDLLGVEKPEWLQGNSMLPLFKGKEEKIRDELHGEVSFHACYEPMRCIRTDRYKYIKFFDDHEQYVPANTDISPAKDLLVNSGFLENTREKEMLFDLYLDPVERTNLIDDQKYQDVYQDLKNRLHQWMKETDDPLLEGNIEKPAGATINKLSCLSNTEKNYL